MSSPDVYPPPIRMKIEEEDASVEVELPPEVCLAIASIALRHDITPIQAIAVSVYNDNFLQEHVENGAQLIIKKGRTYRYLEYN